MHFLITRSGSDSDGDLWVLVGKPKTFETVDDLLRYYSWVPPSSSDGTCCQYPITVAALAGRPASSAWHRSSSSSSGGGSRRSSRSRSRSSGGSAGSRRGSVHRC